MQYIKKFNAIEKIKKQHLNNFVNQIKSMIIELGIDDYTLKFDKEFNVKVRFEDITDRRQMYHLFIDSNMDNIREALSFDKHELIEEFVPEISCRFDNIIFSDEISIETIQFISDFKDKFHLKFEENKNKLIQEITDYIIESKKQNEFYLKYFCEKHYKIDAEKIPEYISAHSFVDAWSPFFYDYYSTIYDSWKRDYSDEHYLNFQKNIIHVKEHRKPLLLMKIEGAVLKFKFIHFEYGYGHKEDTSIEIEKECSISDLFDFNSGFRIDIFKEVFPNSFLNVIKNEIIYNKDKISITKKYYENVRTLQDYARYIIKSMGFEYKLEKNEYFSRIIDHFEKYDIKTTEIKEESFYETKTYQIPYIKDFKNIQYETKHTISLFRYKFLWPTFLNFIKNEKAEMLENIADYYWGIDDVYNIKHPEIGKIFFEIHPKLKR